MTSYSHSKLGTFQQCKYKYKLQYIDKIKVDIPDTVETFMGKLVHKVLEKLYKDLQFQKMNSKEELLVMFEKIWKEQWSDSIVIVKQEYTQNNYKEIKMI
ncbi:MAG: PD-(D/E)XK nuclease family protein [Nanoarchaeota archaeon]